MPASVVMRRWPIPSGPDTAVSETLMFPPRWKLAGYALVVLIGCLVAAPNLFTRDQLSLLPAWLPMPQVALGLDLKGGSHLVLEVDAAAVARERLGVIADSARTALRQAAIAGVNVALS